MGDITRYEQHDAVALIALNRPDSLNAFTTELRAALLAALERARDDDSVRAVVLTGEGRSFSAGADLKDTKVDKPVEDILQEEYRPVQEIIADMPKPVIAAVPGSAAGIGLSVALQCDLLIMADDAFLLSPFTTISLVPDGGLNWMLVRQLGYRRAFQLSVESERIPAARCVELGLANRTVPADQLRDAALEWAHALAKRAPLSLAATKRAMRHAADQDWASSYDVESRLQGDLLGTEDNREGIAAFLEKRAPEFKGK
ncbi:MAG TPA: enoyl-CoA hydratase-related protein [Woeseiaceae bacterium]|nr:enoyl-CoA hydratase-related protein [Woeseiaceae bacterium]